MNLHDSLDIRQLLAVLRRRLGILLLIPIVATATAAIWSRYFTQPIYEASTTLWVVKKETGTQLDLGTLMLNRNLTKNYAEVAHSQTVAAATIRKLGLADSPDSLLKRVTVTTVADTEILRITVQDSGRERTAQIANTLASEFMAELPKFITLDNVRVVDPAAVPGAPVRPRPLLNAALAFAAGVMAAVGLAFLLEALDITLRTPADIEQFVGLPVLGVLPYIETPTAPGPAQSGVHRRRTVADVEGGGKE